MALPEARVQAQRWRRRKEARPSEILDAALDCFAEHGFAATRLDDVAHRAGITKGTLYLYFPNKVVSEAGNFPDLARFYREQVVDRGMALLSRVLQFGIGRGEFRAVELDDTVRCIFAPLLLAMLWRHSLGRHEPTGFDPDSLCETHLQLLLNGLKVRRPVADRGIKKDAT